MDKYVCDMCGDLPDDWVCPLCGVGKDEFVKQE